MANPPERAPIDVEQARRLLDALEQDLRSAGGDPKVVASLMAEVAQLRGVLLAAGRTDDAELAGGLHGVRERLHHLSDELVGDAFQAGRYLAELGRILGLG